MCTKINKNCTCGYARKMCKKKETVNVHEKYANISIVRAYLHAFRAYLHICTTSRVRVFLCLHIFRAYATSTREYAEKNM